MTYSQKDIEDEGRLARMETKLDQQLCLLKAMDERQERQDERIRNLEQKQARTAGAAGVFGAGVAQLIHWIAGNP